MQPTQNSENNASGDHCDGPDQQEVHSQTDSTNAQHQVSQTDKIYSQDSNVQTKPIDTQHSAMQTAPKDEKQSSQQTEKLTFTDTDTQTVYAVRVIEPTADAESQAGEWCPTDAITQTNQSMSLMVEGLSQTELEQADVVCQTEATVTGDQNIQTQVDQSVASSQTVRDEEDAVCQTEVNESEAVIQTDSSMAYLADGEAQTVIEVACQEIQASVDCYIVEAQTDSSMAYLTDQEAQATTESVEQHMQTDTAELQESFVQTVLETDQKFIQTEVNCETKDSQTEVIVIDSESQTEIEEALPVIENVPQVVVQEATVEVNNQVEVNNEMEANLEMPDIPSFGDSQQSQISSEHSSQVLQIVPEFSEEGCQTDPVTIIIGDASFLVKKLKSSSLSPTKVSSMGNEIEIELRADEEEAAPTPYDMPEHAEKEYTVQTVSAPPRTRGNPTPYRARGVRTRGGAVQRGMYRGGNPHGQHVYTHNQSNAGPYYSSSAGVLGKYSCPVCSETFHESPALYEHLQCNHSEAFNLIKKPKGREGKTIQLRPGQETEPPILTPEPIGLAVSVPQHTRVVHQQVVHQHVPQEVVHQEVPQEIHQEVHQEVHEEVHQEVYQPIEQDQPETSQVQIVVEPQEEEPQDDVGLFEDPTTFQSPNKSRKRTLARRQITDEEEANVATESPSEEMHIVIQPVASGTEEEVVAEIHPPSTPGKRKQQHEVLQQAEAKRARTEPPQIEPEPPQLQQEEAGEVQIQTEETPKRRSRSSLRTIKQEKEQEKAPETTPEVKTPRTRGRPRKQ